MHPQDPSSTPDVINRPLIHMHDCMCMFFWLKSGDKRARQYETGRQPQAAGWPRMWRAWLIDIGRSGGQQPAIMDGAMTLYYEQQLS